MHLGILTPVFGLQPGEDATAGDPDTLGWGLGSGRPDMLIKVQLLL